MINVRSRISVLIVFITLLFQQVVFCLTHREVGTTDSPFGYLEFLPSAYEANPQQEFPVLIYYHGAGAGHYGTPDLTKLYRNGPSMILATPSHPLHGIFEEAGVIVLAPQSGGGWWGQAVRDYLDYVFETYRVDRRRVYLTGLSAGSAGIHDLLNDNRLAPGDPSLKPDEVTAVIPVAVVGTVREEGAAMASNIPYWAHTSYGDPFGGMVSAAPGLDAIGSHRLGGTSNVRATDPESGKVAEDREDVTVAWSDANEWVWEYGRIPTGNGHPRMTIYQGASHNSWARTYNNIEVYNWLFAQQKPELTVTSPTGTAIFTPGESILFSAEAKDIHGNTISSENITWTSDRDGYLGSGTDIAISDLSIGLHEIACQVIDSESQGVMTWRIPVGVVYTDAFTAHIDFGDPALETPGNWNNITDPWEGVVDNLVDDQGTLTGMRAAVQERFEWFNSSGVVASDLYPVTAQQDTMYIGAGRTVEILVSNLNPAQTYDFTFFASIASSSGRAVYAVGNDSVSLEAADNTDQTASLSGIVPNATGDVLVTVTVDAGVSRAYLGLISIATAGVAANNDSDNDNLPDDWEIAHFGNLEQVAEGDFDRDGVSNILEFAFGGSPVDALESDLPTVGWSFLGDGAYPEFVYHRSHAGGELMLYEVQRSIDLQEWSAADMTEVSVVPIVDNPGADMVRVRYNHPVRAGSVFLRLKLNTID